MAMVFHWVRPIIAPKILVYSLPEGQRSGVPLPHDGLVIVVDSLIPILGVLQRVHVQHGGCGWPSRIPSRAILCAGIVFLTTTQEEEVKGSLPHFSYPPRVADKNNITQLRRTRKPTPINRNTGVCHGVKFFLQGAAVEVIRKGPC